VIEKRSTLAHLSLGAYLGRSNVQHTVEDTVTSPVRLPRAAFNDRPLLLAHIKQVIRGSANLDSLSGKNHQKGAGRYTLCERCNNLTGHWYGAAYVDWAYQGMQIVLGTKGTPTLIYNFMSSRCASLNKLYACFLAPTLPVSATATLILSSLRSIVTQGVFLPPFAFTRSTLLRRAHGLLV
jgi:hypothetical protein